MSLFQERPLFFFDIALLILHTGIRVKISHHIAYSRMLQAHVLGHRSFCPIRFLAAGDRADEISLNLAGAPPYSLLLLVCRGIFLRLDLLNHFCQLTDFFEDCFQLKFEDMVSEVQFVCLFLVKIDGCMEVALEARKRYGLSCGEFLIIPLRVPFKVVAVSLSTPLDILSHPITHLWTYYYLWYTHIL